MKWATLNSNSPAIANHVLFNFNGINDLRISSSVYGSILAPKAAVSTEWGVIWGQVMAKSWSGNQQVNWSPLEIPPGGNTSVSAPHPTALLLLLPVLILVPPPQCGASLPAGRYWPA